MLAALVAALVVRRLPGRRLMAIVGAVVSLLALRSLPAAVPAASLSGDDQALSACYISVRPVVARGELGVPPARLVVVLDVSRAPRPASSWYSM